MQSNALLSKEHKELIRRMEHNSRPSRLRMHIVLLVADGYCPTYISRVLSCSHTTVHALTRHFLREDRADFYDRQKRGPRRALLDYSAQKRIETLVEGHSPVERGWLRCAGAVLLVRCWHPEREIVAVTDGTYASLKLLDRCRGLSNPITFITRLPAFGRRSVRTGSSATTPQSDGKAPTKRRTPAQPLGPRRRCALHRLLDADPELIISWFVRRWQMEATFQEARQRLGFETQRHWSERGILRTAPALLALFSLVTLLAHRQLTQAAGAFR